MNQTVVLVAMVLVVAGCLLGCEKQTSDEFTDETDTGDIVPLEPVDTYDTGYTPGPITVSVEPASAAPPPSSPAPAGAGRTHTVRRGDTLWSIAKRTYGDGQKWRQIAEANPGLEPTKLRVGQQIVLP